jgi:hypothetical protein
MTLQDSFPTTEYPLRSVRPLLVTVSDVLSSPTLVTLMKEARKDFVLRPVFSKLENATFREILLKKATNQVSGTLCFLAFRTLDNRQSPETQRF